MSVDKIDLRKDNSPALLFRGMVSMCMAVVLLMGRGFFNSESNLEMECFFVQMMGVE